MDNPTKMIDDFEVPPFMETLNSWILIPSSQPDGWWCFEASGPRETSIRGIPTGTPCSSGVQLRFWMHQNDAEVWTIHNDEWLLTEVKLEILDIILNLKQCILNSQRFMTSLWSWDTLGMPRFFLDDVIDKTATWLICVYTYIYIYTHLGLSGTR